MPKIGIRKGGIKLLEDLKIQVGSVVDYDLTEDGWVKASMVKEIKGDKAILANGKEIILMEFDIKQFVMDRYNEAEKEAHVVFENCLILSVKLKNGYVITEHCICRNPKEFDLVKGMELCKKKVFNKLLSIYEVVTVPEDKEIKKFPFKVR